MAMCKTFVCQNFFIWQKIEEFNAKMSILIIRTLRLQT